MTVLEFVLRPALPTLPRRVPGAELAQQLPTLPPRAPHLPDAALCQRVVDGLRSLS